MERNFLIIEGSSMETGKGLRLSRRTKTHISPLLQLVVGFSVPLACLVDCGRLLSDVKKGPIPLRYVFNCILIFGMWANLASRSRRKRDNMKVQILSSRLLCAR